jgi:hypothetical protein
MEEEFIKNKYNSQVFETGHKLWNFRKCTLMFFCFKLSEFAIYKKKKTRFSQIGLLESL